MRTIVLLILLMATSVLSAQGVSRGTGESIEGFVRRVGPPSSQLAHPPVETDAWHLGSNAIVAFYGHTKDLGGQQGITFVISGYAYLPELTGGYRKVFIGEIGPEGADPEIESVFFANATHDSAKEVVLIISWPQVHYDVYGTLYGTLIYEFPKHPGADSFTFLERVSESVSGTCECEWRDGRKAKSKFKTAKQVRIGLRTLGFH